MQGSSQRSGSLARDAREKDDHALSPIKTSERDMDRVVLPYALERKYPNAGKQWGWQWVFPATSHFTDRVTGETRRHHLHEQLYRKR